MSRTSQNFRKHKLLATENMLQFGSGKFFSITPDYRYHWRNSNFTITMVLFGFTGGTVLNATGSTGSELSVSYIGPRALKVSFRTDSGAFTNLSLTDVAVMDNSIFRLTVVRRETALEVWVNNNMVVTSNSLSVDDTFTFDQSIIVGNADVCLSNLVFMLAAPLVSDMSILQGQNVVPRYLRRYVISHYPLNERRAEKAYDICEQYNHGKAIFVSARVPSLTALNGTPVITNGTDEHGAYIEYAAGEDAIPFGTPNSATSGWGGIYPVVSFDPPTGIRFVTGVVKLKLIGPINKGLSFSINCVLTNIDDANEAIDTVLEKRIWNMYTNSSGQMDFTIDYRSTTPGTAVRIYSTELFEDRNTANHCDFQGFTADELGQNNLLMQSAWKNVYNKEFRGSYFWRGNQVNSYAVVKNFGPATYPDFTMAISFRAPGPEIFGAYPNNFTHVFTTRKANYDSGVVGLRLMSTGSIELLNGLGANSADNYFPGEIKSYVLVCKNGGSSDGGYLRLWTKDDHYYQSPGTGPFSFIEEINFSTLTNNRSTDTGRFIMLDKAADENEIRTLRRLLDTDEYKSISNIIMDLDFGNHFDGSHALDYTGNYAIEFFNTTPSDFVSPVDFKGFPMRDKALRFGNNHWLEIPDFVPSGEKGYTYVYQFALDSNRKFGIYENIMSVRVGDDFQKYMYLLNNGVNGNVIHFSGGQSASVFTGDLKADFSRLMTVAVTEGNGISRIYVNGVFVLEIPGTGNNLTDALTKLYIGKNGNVFNWFNGYMTFAGVWRGILTPRDIYNLSQGQYISPSDDCQLYLMFDQIKRLSPDYHLTDISSGWTTSGDATISYGEDADGKYVEIMTGSDEQCFIDGPYGTKQHALRRDYVSTWRIKIMDDPYFAFIRLYGQPTNVGVGTQSGDPIGIVFDKVIRYNSEALAEAQPGVYLFGYSTAGQRLRIYSITDEEADAYQLVDYSKKNNRVLLKGYTPNEVTPTHADYALIDRDSLR